MRLAGMDAQKPGKEVVMAKTWMEIAHEALDDKDNDVIKANPTNLTKYGATAVGVVTVALTAVLGSAWSLNPKEPAVVIAAAIIAASVVIGICAVFANDVHTRGVVTAARFEAVTKLAEVETDETVSNLKNEVAAANSALDQAKADLKALQQSLHGSVAVVVTPEAETLTH
jgi:hypothetical protein